MLKSNLDTNWISVKIGKVFSKFGISPDTWTIISLVPAVLGFVSLYYHNLIGGMVLFLISGIIDLIDGSVARITGTASDMGAFLDGIVDRYVEILLYTGLLLYGVDAIWIVLLVFGGMMPTYVRAYADHRKVVTDPLDHKKMGGLLERSERLNLILLGMFIGHFNDAWLTYVIILVVILANLTAFMRIRFVLRKN